MTDEQQLPDTQLNPDGEGQQADPEPAVPAAEPADPAVVAEGPAEDPRFRQNMWAGHMHFECKLCQFDTLNYMALVEHLETQHLEAI